MLTVSDLLRVARSSERGDELARRSPHRFCPPARGVPVVVWNVVGHCNLSCPHCYAAASSRPSPDVLGTAEGLGLLDQLAETGTRVVIFSGGEPLLRPDLFELIERARALGLSPQLSTNGVLVDDAAAERLAGAGVGYVGISIDGMRAFNDGYRGMQGGFDRATRGLVSSKRAGMRTGLRVTLSRLNADELEPLLAHATELGVDRFYVSHLLYSGRAFRMHGDDLSPLESRRALERLFELALEHLEDPRAPDIVTGGNDSDGPALALFAERRLGHAAAARIERWLSERGGNSAGEKLLNVDHLGRVFPDQFWRTACLGNVREQRWSAILEHPLRRELRERVRRVEGRCKGCRQLELCRGSHRERAEHRFGDAWASDPACVLSDEEIGLLGARGARTG